jgi:hypothetical protein
MGAILEQLDALNHWHPVAFHSKSLQPAERNYEIHDKELLTIVRACDDSLLCLVASPRNTWMNEDEMDV